MKPGFINELSSSFAMWLDNKILSEAEGYYNYSGYLNLTEDPFFSDNFIYASKYRQWVSDSDVTGAVIPSGFYSGDLANFIPKDADNRIDYGMGRVISSTINETGKDIFFSQFSVKEFNIYLTYQSETYLLFEDSLLRQTKFNSEIDFFKYNENPYPAIFIKFSDGRNNPFAFGGIDEADWNVRCTILSDSAFKLDSVISCLSDSSHSYLKHIETKNIPFNVFGDIKSGEYSYSGLVDMQTGNNFVYIDSVEISKFSEKINKTIKENFWGAFADFKLLSIKI
jgi:hypothetical protein